MSPILQQEPLSVSQISNETNMEPLPMRERLPKPNYTVFLNISQPLRAGSICMNRGRLEEGRGGEQARLLLLKECDAFLLFLRVFMDEKEGNFIWSIFCCLLCDIFQMRLPDLPHCLVLFAPAHVIHWDDIRGANVLQFTNVRNTM